MIRNFWDKNAHIYNHFMKKDARAYEKMYELMRRHGTGISGFPRADICLGTTI